MEATKEIVSAEQARSQTRKLDLVDLTNNILSAAKQGQSQLNLININHDANDLSKLIRLGYQLSSGVNNFGDTYLTIKW